MTANRSVPVRLALALAGACALLAGSGRPLAQSEPIYDYLFRNGHVIDPAAGRNGRMDIAVAGDRIVRIDLPCSPCNRIRLPPERCVGHTPDCLAFVSTDLVLTAALAVLAGAARTRAGERPA